MHKISSVHEQYIRVVLSYFLYSMGNTSEPDSLTIFRHSSFPEILCMRLSVVLLNNGELGHVQFPF